LACVMVFLSKHGFLSWAGVLAAAIPTITCVFGTMFVGIYLAKIGKLD